MAAHQQRGQLAQGELQRQRALEVLGHAPDAAVAVGGALGVEREAGLLQGVEVAPDRADGDRQVPGSVVDRDALGAVDQLEELPLPAELIATGHPSIVVVRPLRVNVCVL